MDSIGSTSRALAPLRRLIAFAAAAAVVAVGAAAVRAQAAAPLQLGVDAIGRLASPKTSVLDHWVAVAAADGATRVRIPLDWSSVAPSKRPAGFEPSNPASPGYSWAATDALVRAYAAQGFSILITISDAPRWAEGSRRPSPAAAGTWEPDPTAFAQFANAAASRYSGDFPDPQVPGHALPRARYWEAWNEPNLSEYLTPQWIKRGQHFVAEAPRLYRKMLNAFYGAIKHVSRHDVVVAGGTAPFGDLTPSVDYASARIPPATFLQDLLCLRGTRLRSGHCHNPAHFDIYDHHPFDVGSPTTHASNPGDVSVPDMRKLSRLLRAARRAHMVLPRRRKSLWVTELAWGSRPPDPSGVPILRQARWVEQGFYVLWTEGVRTSFWLQLVDDSNLAAGLYFSNGHPKPSADAYTFPFVTTRKSQSLIHAWGRAPAAGLLVIQRRQHGAWSTMHRMRVRRFQTFSVNLRLAHSALLRATLGQLTSITWRPN